MAYRPPRYYSDSEIIKLSLLLYPEETQVELKNDATVLMAAVHARNPRTKVMMGEMMSFELLYKLGRFLNENYPV